MRRRCTLLALIGCGAALAGSALAGSVATAAGALGGPMARPASASWTVGAPGGGLVPQEPDCVSSALCYALVTDEPQFSASNGGTGVIRTFDGGRKWSSILKVTQRAGYSSVLTDVSCTSTAFCVATGNEYPDSTNARYTPFVYYSPAGKHEWHPAVSLPEANAYAKGGTEVAAVSCPTSSFCVAVGAKVLAGSTQGPVAWATSNGGANWKLLNVGSSQFALDAVACTSAAFCVLGSSGGVLVSTSAQLNFAPPPAIAPLSVQAVACAPGTHSCIAAGSVAAEVHGKIVLSPTAVATSNGSGWTGAFGGLPAGIPAPPSGAGELDGASCPGAGRCVVVGDRRTSSSVGKVFVLATANAGRSWQSEGLSGPSAATLYKTGVNLGVSCAGTGFCLAGGLASSSTANDPTYELSGAL